MSDLIDPLKLYTYGVKKPLEEKADKLKEISDNKHMRYYPTDKQGKVDEWAAVIKHQEDMYKNEVERKRIEKVEMQKQYYEDLKKGIEDKRRNQQYERMVYDNDSNIMNFK